MRAALLVPIVGNVGRFGRSAAGGNMRRGNVGTVRVNVVRAILAVLFCTGSAFADVSFQGLGDLPGGTYGSWAYGVSADGSVVVGVSRSGNGTEAFRWTQDGMVGLGFSSASAVSADGSVVVGQGRSGNGPEAFRWTQDGMVGLGDLPGGGHESSASGVSADGSVVVGRSLSDRGFEAFRWTQDGMVGLGDLPGAVWPGGRYDSSATSVSADGSVVVGYGRSASGAEAFRWTQDGMVSLGGLPGVGYDPSNMLISAATSVSADGSVVVGYARSGEGKGNEAFIWDEINGMRSLLDVLKSHEVPEVAGWSLALAKAISADGLTIVGYGVNPSGQSEAWRATLGHTAVVPVPGAVLLGMLGLGYAGMRLRRQAS